MNGVVTPATDVVVRAMRDDDVDSVFALLVRSEEIDLALDVFANVRRGRSVFIAESPEDGVVGFLEGRIDANAPRGIVGHAGPPPYAWVFDVVVDPEARRRGVGRRLLQGFRDAAESAGCTSFGLTIYAGANDDAARRFFAACGLHTVVPPSVTYMSARISTR